ncbi:MAG: GH116 family glycosyl-hydrolase [Chloroflexi bacterium]|nr:GH116 family glycosyl-hydrolase [Chloroflexota bacterium]
MEHFIYRGAKTNQISFPLGGIGSGSIGLAGNGRLLDWEIFNRPNKGSVNGFSHFAIKAEANGQLRDARILHGDLATPFQGEIAGARFNSFGFGPRREYMTGLAHFHSVDFQGEYPLAELTYHEDRFPGQVKLLAFNPLIPLNDQDSSIPAAFFEFSITNTTQETLTYTLAGVLANPLPANNLNTIVTSPTMHALHLRSDSVPPDSVKYGDLTLATDHTEGEVSWQQYWFRGAWFDSVEVYWRDFTTPGLFKNRVYEPGKAGERNEGLLAAHVSIAPGETKQIRFVIAWNFPNCENYWKPVSGTSIDRDDMGEDYMPPKSTWKNYYATLWQDSRASAEYALSQWDRLYAETKRYHDALFASDLPPAALDAVSANISILKSSTVLRLEDGTFYGWEGVHPTEGCCEGSCTHVWNYAQALPFLFPKLERSMRTADYVYNLRADGGMPFRLQLPIGIGHWKFRACADGQFGGVLKIYRDWKISGDSEWLRLLWPAVKKSIEFTWAPTNEDRWDPDKTGVLMGRQHHTLDMELFGPNAWLSGFYLGALKAGAEMAEHVGDQAAADEYRAIFAKGKAWVDEHLFNGEYYIQRIDLKDKQIVEAFAQDEVLIQGGNTLSAYWNEEHEEIKYQIAEGSSIDQLLAQWHASLYGLGEIFDPEQVKKANAAIFKYNFVPVMGDVYNPCRIFCLNDEGGLVICAWPEGSQKPLIPAPYSQETMNGFEYSAAIHMIQTGLVDEGMTCVEALRKRYDGERRNPWNEFECGSNYARSMASYALLNAFSGFEFDMVQHLLGFNPVRPDNGQFRCFWSLDSGWGEFEMGANGVEVRLLYGHLDLQTLRLPFLANQTVKSVGVGAQTTAFTQADGTINLAGVTRIEQGQALRLTVG